ncbi:MAG: CinA family nicotinamide mononucleotide deamidase-related protein [Thermoleophilia bacterium]
MAGRPRAILVVSGSELVRGDRRDANGPFVAAQLVRLGIDPARIVIVGDRPEELRAAIADGLAADLLVCSGGLGPTHDDRTIELLAEAAGRGLRVDEGLEARIEAVSRAAAERLGRPYHDFAAGVRKQATLPDGADEIGLAGTAPGVLLPHGDRVAIALPGPPHELQRLWPGAVAHPAFQRLLERVRPRRHRVLRFFGPSESSVARAIDATGGEGGGVEVTVCARALEIHVDLYVEADGEPRALELERALLDEFGPQLFAEDERPLEELVLALCRAQGLTVATAESCTGGLVGGRLTEAAGSSDVFLGGVVAYANAVKEARLGVPAALLAAHGAVSAEVAAAMACGARAAIGADVGLAVTGVAGPGGGSDEKPVGLVFVHVETPTASVGRRLQLPGDRGAIRERAIVTVLHLLRDTLSRSRHGPV